MRDLIFIIFILIVSHTLSYGQQADCSVPKEYIVDSIIDGQNIKYLRDNINKISFCVVSKSAEFQGGNIEKFRDWVMNNIDYKKFSTDSVIQGKLNFLFMINSAGKMSDLIISQGLSHKIDKEVYCVINSSPEWKPAKQGGKKTNQLFGLPIMIYSSKEKNILK